jgi:conjugal transfer pilus assembly protein TraV
MRCHHLAFPLVLLAVSGCATLSGNVHGDWACDAPNGTCAPLSTIDQQAILSIGSEAPQPRTLDAPQRRTPSDPVLAGFASVNDPSRTAERTLRILFPAYVDKAGLYFEPAAVHAVVASPTWSSTPERLASTGAPDRDTSAGGRSDPRGSALASMDEVVASRAARRGAQPVPPVQSDGPPPAATEAAVLPSPDPDPSPARQAAASPFSSPTVLPAPTLSHSVMPLPDSGVVAATPTGTPAAVAVPLAPVQQTSAVPAPSNRPDSAAPYGYRTVVWKGKQYRIARKSPPPQPAAAAAQAGSTAAVRALNLAALKAATASERLPASSESATLQ